MSKTIFRCGLAGLALAVALAFHTVPAFAAPVVFKGDLKGAKGNGRGTVTATYDKGVLSWTVRYSGLSGKPTAAHFHGPADPGQSAGVQVNSPNIGNPMTGAAVVSDLQAPDLMANRWYFNIHTKAVPAGEIRGQLMRAN